MIQFINQDPRHRALSDTDRRIVRTASNKAAAATRKARGAGPKVNTLQLPDFLIATAETDCHIVDTAVEEAGDELDKERSKSLTRARRDSSYSTRLRERGNHAVPIARTLSLWPNNSKSPQYVALLMQPGLSQKLLVDAAGLDVNSDPRRWVKICRLTSVLQFLPQMIGQNGCLDCAIDCLAERVRQTCVVSQDRRLERVQLDQRYGRALRLLQSALDSTAKIDWTLWYTTLLLALFEVGQRVGRAFPMPYS